MPTIPPDAYVIIIGSMKSGTTTLYGYLAQNPQLCPCVTKEPEFFSENQGHEIKGVVDYESLWQFDPRQHRYALEASTGYTKYPQEQNVAQRMRSYGIAPKLIYIVRDPFGRIESMYNWSITKNWFDPREKITSDGHVSISDYFMQLREYRECFGRERILVLDFDELVGQPESLLSRVARFLDLDKLELPPAQVSRHEMLTTLYRKSPGRLQRAVHDWILRPVTPIAATRRLTDVERRIVHDKLEDGMRRFHSEYGFDVAKWGFDV